MAQTINTNVASLNAQRNLNTSQSALATSLQRLSSGLRINSAKDDTAGLAISERMTAQIRGMNQAGRNANDGVSLAQTAEGDLVQITNNLQRIRELAVQSANSTNSATDRTTMQAEVAQLIAETDRIAANSTFNGVKLLDGTFTSQVFQVGANNTSNDRITITAINSARTTSLGASTSATVTTSAVNTTASNGSNVSLNGVSIIASVSDGVSTVNADASAKAKATAINATSGTGVTAVANATTLAGAAMTRAATTGTITINGVTTASISTLGASDAADRALVIAGIQAISGATGVTATDDGVGVTLTAADGRNIVHSFTTLDSVKTGVAAAATTLGTLTLTSTSSITAGGTTVAILGSPTTTAATSTGTSVANTTVATSAGALAAMTSIDSALNAVNSIRGTLGAFQNRFEATVASLQTSSENLSASRSRIQDTDFAAEVAALTRNQILQQAGTAMLAQANSLPQNVLSLLK